MMTANASENRSWNGVLIPPAPITPCGHLTDTAEKFYDSACEEADRLLIHLGLDGAKSILDIGCGVGRLPIGLLARTAPFSFYLGVDVDKTRLDWCLNNLMPEDPRLHFKFIDMHNARYNPGGREKLNLALPPDCIDIVYVYSVFSHLEEQDAREYLGVIARLLRRGGTCFLTMFVADGVAPVTENPQGYGPFEWVGRLHCVLYEKNHWLEMLASSGLQVAGEIPMVNADMQTGYLLTHAR
jgi:SAM-dependent methyltransferase